MSRRPATEDARVSRLNVEEEAFARGQNRDPLDFIALPVVALPDMRRNPELGRNPMTGAEYFLIPLVLQLPASGFEYSRLMDVHGAPTRGPTDGMLPMLAARLVIPRRNLTDEGWALVSEFEQASENQERARWGLVGWTPVDDVPAMSALYYVNADHPGVPRAREVRVAALVFGGDALQVAVTQTLDRGVLAVQTFTPRAGENIAELHVRASEWAFEQVRAWLVSVVGVGAQVSGADA